jgi:hypothetical protein
MPPRAAIIAVSMLTTVGTKGQGIRPTVANPPPIAPVTLGDVLVRAQPKLLLLRAPGEASGLRDAVSSSLRPGQQLAVWHPTPNSGHAYRIRAVRARLGSRNTKNVADLARHRRNFLDGRLALRLSVATATGQPADTNLLVAPLLLTPALSEGLEQGWVRFEVSDQRLMLPAPGLFVVAQGLTTAPDEQFIRHRTLMHPADRETPPQDLEPANHKASGKGPEVFLYEEIQLAGTKERRLVPSANFPAIAHRSVATPAECRSWQWFGGLNSGWKFLAAMNAEFRQRTPSLKLTDYNYDLELEVEEL